MVASQVQKELFKKWLKENRNISESTFISYTEGVLDKIREVIRLSNNAFVKNLNPDLYSYDTLDKYDKFFNLLKNDPNFDIVNKTGQAQSGWLSTPLNHYRRFLEYQILHNANLSNFDINGLRNNLIQYYINKGLTTKNNSNHTVLALNKNIAEVHFVNKHNKQFKIAINYDLIDKNLLSDVRKVPETHKWTLDGEYWVTSLPTYYKAIDIINSILTNLNIVQNNSSKITNTNIITNQPLNQILYGPPGTGKTYSIQEYIQNLLSKNPGLNINSEEQKLNDIVKDLSWYTTIAISMYLNGKQNKYKVSDLMNQKIIKAFALTRENKNLRAALWAQMQIHTSEDCKTVNYTNRQTPFIFEKNENSEWYLTEDGIKYVEENLADQIAQYKAPSNTRKIEDFYKFITFHQSYSYEEFVEGIKPKIDVNDDSSTISYEYNRGIFKEICQQANSDPDNKYLLIIDEINRGNISKIFGELITLIETNKRVRPNKERNFENTKVDKEQLLVTLPYTKSKFGVPSNLYILGTMNTSDRSIASIDIALRRRFKFIEMMPKPELVADFGCNFKNIFEKLNTKIKILLDRDHQIGHSYFINTKYENADIKTLKEIWFSEIIPLLNEYFYCDWEKLKLIIPGFIKPVDVPTELKNECEETMYEFKTPDEIQDFEGALKQEKYEQES